MHKNGGGGERGGKILSFTEPLLEEFSYLISFNALQSPAEIWRLHSSGSPAHGFLPADQQSQAPSIKFALDGAASWGHSQYATQAFRSRRPSLLNLFCLSHS